MPRTLSTLTLSDAKQMLEAGEQRRPTLAFPTTSPWSMQVAR